MAKRSKAPAAKKPAAEFPKTLVRVTMGPGNTPVADSVRVENAEAETSMGEMGYKALDDVVSQPPAQEYPAWRYSADGSRRIVNSEEEDDKLEGDWSDSPTETAQPVDTDLTRAKAVLGDEFAEKLNTVGDAVLGNPRAAKRADGNFDPATVAIAQGDSAAQRDAKVQASTSTAPARGAQR